MASSDVIELGSSDDEAEPVPKKKKPTINAMVHFPNEVPGLVIKPVKPAIPNLQKVLAGGAVTITNVKKDKVTPQINKVRTNGRSNQKFIERSQLRMPIVRNPITINNLSVNPLSFIRKQLNVVNQAPKLSLPPGITVKRTQPSQRIQSNVAMGKKKQNLKRKQPEQIVTTVELDDEEVPLTSGTSPLWYLRPEEQISHPVDEKENAAKAINDDKIVKDANMELVNNKEPDIKKYIEITIEDSPIKPCSTQRGFIVGSELPITIEDSPVKPLKTVKDKLYDAEKCNVTEPQSKKRLDYPDDEEAEKTDTIQSNVEIDLEAASNPVGSEGKDIKNQSTDANDNSKDDREVKKVDSPKRIQTVLINKDMKEEENSNKTNIGQKSEIGEFHPVYQKFIDVCFELENSADMIKIVEKKIKTYYKQCPKEYVQSEEFIDMVSSKIFAMKVAPDKMYLYIKDIVDELNMQRKTAKTVGVSNEENKSAGNDKFFTAEEGEYDGRRRRQIRKLEKTIKKLHRAIQKLEEQEVEFEDEEDSVYLLTERYKERLIKVHAKFCQLTNTKMPSEPRIQIEARPGQPIGPAKRLEKWVNKKVPIGKPLPFPDFHDVLRCVREANAEDRLGWNEADIMQEARDLFTRCGKKLQRRRQENEWRIAAARISQDTLDPAEKSDDLKRKLDENKNLAAKKEIDLLNKFADKQNQLKLVGEEIGDKEAEESPVESEEDEGNDESNSLGDKQKRKERLKRLLHEKTKQLSSVKDNTVTDVKVNKEEDKVAEEVEKMVCDTVLNESENNKEINEVKNNAELIDNDALRNVSGDGLSDDEKRLKSDSTMYDVDSDIDEMHLLQKLYSENEINSSTQESDSDTPIAISDTLDSDSETDNVRNLQSDDIISIENSSYSESEVIIDECESAKAQDVVKGKSIDSLLVKNVEVLLHSCESKENLDVDEENILLASSEEETDPDHFHADNIKVSTCDVEMINDGVANDGVANDGVHNCHVILSDCDQKSIENDMETYEVPLHKEAHVSNDNNVISIDDSQGHSGFKELLNQKSNTLLESHSKSSESKNTTLSIEENEDNLKTVGSIAIVSKVVCDEANCTAAENILGMDSQRSSEIDNNRSEEYGSEKKLINDINPIKKVEIKILAREKNMSEHFKDNSEEHESSQESVINKNVQSELNNVESNNTPIVLHECELNDNE